VVTGNARAVLVVEDEALIRMLLASELEEAGFIVHEAGSGDEALTLLEGGLPVAAVVTDVRMPGRLDGLGLAAWLRGHRHALPVVVTSGFVTAADALAVNPAIKAVLSKPYDPAEVVTLLGHLVAAGGAD
jgi:CheY-like chemotaxis protein